MSDYDDVTEINYARILHHYKISLKFLISYLFVVHSVSKLLAALSQLPGGTPAAGAPLLSAETIKQRNSVVREAKYPISI